MKKVKQKLLKEPLSFDALKLARAIYFTYLEDENNLYLEIKIDTIKALFHLETHEEAVGKLKELLMELCEPLGVKNFYFYGKFYPMRFITFCTYTIKEDVVELILSDEFLYAQQEYMLDSFIT